MYYMQIDVFKNAYRIIYGWSFIASFIKKWNLNDEFRLSELINVCDLCYFETHYLIIDGVIWNLRIVYVIIDFVLYIDLIDFHSKK